MNIENLGPRIICASCLIGMFGLCCAAVRVIAILFF